MISKGMAPEPIILSFSCPRLMRNFRAAFEDNSLTEICEDVIERRKV